MANQQVSEDSQWAGSGFGEHKGHRYIFARETAHAPFKMKINGVPVPENLGPAVYTERDVRKKATFLIDALQWGDAHDVLRKES